VRATGDIAGKVSATYRWLSYRHLCTRRTSEAGAAVNDWHLQSHQTPCHTQDGCTQGQLR